MAGYDAQTGRRIYGDARLVQAIRRLIVTHKSLVMRRHLTCDLPAAIGTPLNPANRQLICASVADAIYEHEKRVELDTIRLADGRDGTTAEKAAEGVVRLVLTAWSKETGRRIDLSEVIQ